MNKRTETIETLKAGDMSFIMMYKSLKYTFKSMEILLKSINHNLTSLYQFKSVFVSGSMEISKELDEIIENYELNAIETKYLRVQNEFHADNDLSNFHS